MAAAVLLVAVCGSRALFVPRGASWPGVLAPRRWRRWHRLRHGREWCRSARISDRVRRRVLRADRYQCVCCGSPFPPLHVDHVCPWLLGGLTSLFNLMTLCARCNLLKSCYWRDGDGYEHYNRMLRSPARLAGAAAVLAAERRARRSPLRWLRLMLPG